MSAGGDDRPDEAGRFRLVSVLLAVSPGPGMLFIATRALARGRAAGFASVAGVAAGSFTTAVAAALGLAALLALWLAALQALRVAGGAYLLWLRWPGARGSGLRC